MKYTLSGRLPIASGNMSKNPSPNCMISVTPLSKGTSLIVRSLFLKLNFRYSDDPPNLPDAAFPFKSRIPVQTQSP